MRSRNKELSKTSSSQATGYSAGSGGICIASSQAVNTEKKTTLTHERIAERAKALWLASGCVPGRDDQNWHEAEAQLKAESKSC